MSDKQTRKLAAILFADIVGYTALMQKDDATANILLDKFHQTLNNKVAAHTGQVINNYGDGCVCTFDSTINAMRCAKEVQSIYQQEPKVPVRIGLHSGDVLFKENNVYGDSVNIASRIESLGKAGAVLFSERIKNNIANQSEFQAQSVGSFEFKNVKKPMEVFALANEGMVVPQKEEMKGKVKAKTQGNRKWLVPAVIGLVLALVGSFYFFNKNKISTPTIIDAITIFPFDIKSGSPDIQYLGNGMVDLISTKLEGVPNLNPIDPNRVFNQLKKENVEVPALEKALEISNTLGAAEFILGSIIEINDALQISATKYDAKGGLVAKETIDGKKTQLASLIDDLTRTLIADKLEQEGQELSSLAMMTSDDLPALKSYLEGEQAFRKTEWNEAVSFFQTAVSLDSTFAMAWLRLNDSKSWVSNTIGDDFLDKAMLYADKLPPKWQDLIEAQKMFETGQLSNENHFASMLRTYGENPQFTTLMAEHLFHYNPIHGRSVIEAKPWLAKSRELDPHNQESLRHLGDIAWLEGDKEALQQILDEVSSESLMWVRSRKMLLMMQDSVTEIQLEELASHPKFRLGFFFPNASIPENPNHVLETGLRFGPYVDHEGAYEFLPMVLAILSGQETKAGELMSFFEEKYKFRKAQKFDNWTEPASIIANRDYLPFEENYPWVLDSLATIEEPRAYFTASKYAWVLNKEELYQAYKNKLAIASNESRGIINPARYFHWSLAAFEARQIGDNDNSLVYIDSAFHYNPDESFFMASECAMDKIFMLADIYEEDQEYEKGIQRLENIPMWGNYYQSKGYATYRLSQLYEKNGDVNKALAKCNLFLKNYKDCDEKYRPWVEEVTERRQRLMSKLI